MRKIFYNGNNCGKLMMLVGALVAIPLLVLPFYPQDIKYALSFFIPAIVSVGAGLVVCVTVKQDNSTNWQYTLQSGSLTVLFAWGYGILTGAMPFVISGQLSCVQAIFESVSGWTTTGLSVMDVSVTPHIFLFHRSFMQFCGGLGFIMMMIMIVQGKQSMNLYSAEGHPDRLLPNIKKTAQSIVSMFCMFLAAGTLLYALAGMNVFDSINHTMCALSTGGFSTKLNSIGEYNSVPINIVTIILMIIGTTNFAVLQLFVKGKFREVIRVSEVRFMTVILVISIPLTALSLIKGMNMSAGEGFMRALFDNTSALSTTGYSSMAYTNWPPFAIGMLILLMLIGGGIGSTAGGIKLSRIYLFLRIALASIRKKLMPARNINSPYYYKAQGKTIIDNTLIFETAGFIACYFMLYIIGTALIILTAKCTLTEAMFEFASALGTVGLSIGLTGPATSMPTLIVEIVGMIMGRLEIYIVLIGIFSAYSVAKKRIYKFKIKQKIPEK